MTTPIFDGEVYKGKLTLYDKVGFIGYLTSIYGQVEVVVRRKRVKRSIKENNYYWGVVIRLTADYTGFLDDEMHDAWRWKFLRKSTGKMETVRSTTSLSTKEMEDYLEKIRTFALTEWNLTIPLPKKVDIE